MANILYLYDDGHSLPSTVFRILIKSRVLFIPIHVRISLLGLNGIGCIVEIREDHTIHVTHSYILQVSFKLKSSAILVASSKCCEL